MAEGPTSGPKEGVEPESLIGGGAKDCAGAELESGDRLVEPMIEDWGSEDLEKSLQVWLGQSGWS